jgi:RNA polymerase sigma-70 factor (ECF subfamily)
MQKLDRQALVDVYEENSPGLYRYAFRLLGNQDTAEECVSETFSRFLQAVQQGKGPTDNVRAYLYRTAHNWVIDQYRQQPLPPLELDENLHADSADNPSSAVARNQIRNHVRAALLRLPADQRQVMQLRFFENWSHDEVAAAIGKSIEATRALQHRAMQAMRRMLLEKEEA